MKTYFLVISLILTLWSASAGPIVLTPDAASNWVSDATVLTQPKTPLAVSFEFEAAGAIGTRVELLWYDKDGGLVTVTQPKPVFHLPVPDLFGQRLMHSVAVMPHEIPPSAQSVKLKITGGPDGSEQTPGNLTVYNASVKVLYRPEPDKPLNWFDMSAPVGYQAVLPPGKSGFRGLVYDSSDQLVADIKSDGNRWQYRPRQPGYYHVRFFWLDNAGNETSVSEKYYIRLYDYSQGSRAKISGVHAFERDMQNFAVSSAPPRTPGEMPPVAGFSMELRAPDYIDYAYTLEDEYTAAQLISGKFLRLHWLSWDQCEPEPGRYDWHKPDQALATAAKFGFAPKDLIVNVLETPRWNSPHPERTIWPDAYYYYKPKDLNAWSAFLEKLVEHYPQVTNWELWNEPHLPGQSVFWRDGSPEDFARLLEYGYRAIKQKQPQSNVIMGGIGMRYLPFYRELAKAGGLAYFDTLAMHGVGDIRPFHEIEIAATGKPKPFIDSEWHAVLYNCTEPVLPTEEDLAYKMVLNYANELRQATQKIAVFGLFTGPSVPESAKLRARLGGIQQIAGLFRSMPYREPRLPALVLRTLIDRFAGEIQFVGAWSYAQGVQNAALFHSESGDVLLFWAQEGSSFVPDPALRKALGLEILDWEGRQAALDSLRPRQVYYALKPDRQQLPIGSNTLSAIVPTAREVVLERLANGVYAPLTAPRNQEISRYVSAAKLPQTPGFAAQFAVDYNMDGLLITVKVHDVKHVIHQKDLAFWEGDSVQFAIDCEGKGLIADTLEFAVNGDGTIYKTKAPALKGDIPAEYTDPGIPLRYGRAQVSRQNDDTVYQIEVKRSDLYPLTWQANRPLRFSILVNNNDGDGRAGYLEWASGIGDGKAPHRYGTLYPATDQSSVATTESLRYAFQNAKLVNSNGVVQVTATSAQQGAGAVTGGLTVQPGARYRFGVLVRGKGDLQVIGFGQNLPRQNLAVQKLGLEWREITGEIAIPMDGGTLQMVFFTWQDGEAVFEIKDFWLKGL